MEKEILQMIETCAVCRKGKGPEKCEVCGFSDNGFINRNFPIPEDAVNWLETVVKPYRVQWEAEKREAELLERLERAGKKEAELSAQLEEARRREAELLPQTITRTNAFTDPRDGKVYKTVKIGNQVWMVENLNYNAAGSKCYDNDPKNAEKYGRLYDWKTAMKACPPGWHLPSNEEWDELYRFVDEDKGTNSHYESRTAGRHLKAMSGWNDQERKSGNGDDKLGFSALPGGSGYSDGRFIAAGYDGYWWSASEYDSYYAYYRNMYYCYEYAYWYLIDKSYLFSVRCVQDNDQADITIQSDRIQTRSTHTSSPYPRKRLVKNIFILPLIFILSALAGFVMMTLILPQLYPNYDLAERNLKHARQAQSTATAKNNSAKPNNSSVKSNTGNYNTVSPFTFTDSRDGKKYKAVKIGSQTWMAENLNYNASGSKCYDNNSANCTKYGRLYNWTTAKTACPIGWHLPTKTEWDILTEIVGGEKIAGKLLKVKSGWNDYEGKSGNGDDKFGFSALPGGCGLSGGSFSTAGDYGYWWSASESRSNFAYRRRMYYGYEFAFWDYYDKSYLFSVRCVQD